MRVVVFIMLLMLPLSSAYAEDVNALKAAYLFYFSKFITWNKPQNNDYVKICIHEMNREMKVQVESLKNKTINKKPLLIEDVNDLNSLETCDVVYIQKNSVQLDAGALRNLVVVTNKDSEFSDINFFVSNGRLRFSINRQKIESKAIKVSSRLLRLSSRM